MNKFILIGGAFLLFSCCFCDYCPDDELGELNLLPAQLSYSSVEYRAFIISIEFNELLDYIKTLTANPNFPYLSTSDLQALADLADKLRFIDEIIIEQVPDYDLSE